MWEGRWRRAHATLASEGALGPSQVGVALGGVLGKAGYSSASTHSEGTRDPLCGNRQNGAPSVCIDALARVHSSQNLSHQPLLPDQSSASKRVSPSASDASGGLGEAVLPSGVLALRQPILLDRCPHQGLTALVRIDRHLRKDVSPDAGQRFAADDGVASATSLNRAKHGEH